MPNNNQTGPRGEGAMTGRKLGNCNKDATTENSTPERLHLSRRGGQGRNQQAGRRGGQNRRNF
jgi:hypothetical protein